MLPSSIIAILVLVGHAEAHPPDEHLAPIMEHDANRKEMPEHSAVEVPPEAPEDEDHEDDWPRVFERASARVVMYQPQIDRWDSFARISARAAVAVTLKGAETPEFGSVRFSAATTVDIESRQVRFGSRDLGGAMFSDTDAATYGKVRETLLQVLPLGKPIVMSLDEIIAYLDLEAFPLPEVEVELEPPPIFASRAPAILVIFIGARRFEPILGTGLRFGVNTNWDVFQDDASSRYYLLNGESWLETSDVEQGPWSPATVLPDSLQRLPDDEEWAEVRTRLPGIPVDAAPVVFVSRTPAELIVTEGEPELEPIAETQISSVVNTENDLFHDAGDEQYYLLTAGRWFRAPSIDGPWSAATLELPDDFASIPEDHAMGYVRASVPGTDEATAAILLARVPRIAKIKRDEAKLTVTYEGTPQFVEIDASDGVAYAVNTYYDVFRVDDGFYCCADGVWFDADGPEGPWAVCAEVPDEIYSIPGSSPKHNVTYATVVSSTADEVEFSQTAGYTGQYVVGGLLVFGLGYALLHDADWNVQVRLGSHYYSYGSGARYDYYHGGYFRASSRYGPNGGVGRYASFNPSTGTYSRGAAATGRYRSVGVREAYNPYTGRYGPQARGSTPYGSWGRAVVTDGKDWVRGGRASGARGTVGGIETSDGAAIVAGRGRRGGRGAIVRTEDGDIYAGRGGRVYRRDGSGEWNRRQGGDWRTLDRDRSVSGKRAELRRQHGSRSRGTQRARQYQRSRGQRPGGARRGGGRRR